MMRKTWGDNEGLIDRRTTGHVGEELVDENTQLWGKMAVLELRTAQYDLQEEHQRPMAQIRPLIRS